MVSFRLVSTWGASSGRFLRFTPYYGGLWRKVLGDRLLFSTYLVAATLHGLGQGVTALAAALLASALTGSQGVTSSRFGASLDPLLLSLVGVVATLVKATGATIGATVQSRLAQKVVGSVRQDVARRILLAGTSKPPGPLAAGLAVRLREIEAGVEGGALAGLRAALALFPLAVALYLVSSRLAWAALALLVPFALALSFARGKWKRLHAQALSVAEGLHRQVDELVVHMDVWRTYGAEARVVGALHGLSEQATRAATRAEALRAALSSANEMLAALALLACMAGAHRMSVPLGDGTLVAFAAIVFLSYRPLRDLGDARSFLERGEQALASLDDLLPRANGAVPNASSLGRAWSRDTLVAKRVGVPRSGDAPFTSFTADTGEITAIVGPTGSGKTTLLRALLGLEATASGIVRYGDEDLTANGVGPAERPFAWMPQEAPIIAGTLDDNLLGDAPERERAWAFLDAIGAARLHDVCGDAGLGSSGRPISGGERKWIAMARAIATGLPVLLLDEPTSGLDRSSRERVIEALRRLRGERTIVLVSHELDVIAIADRVVRIGQN